MDTIPQLDLCQHSIVVQLHSDGGVSHEPTLVCLETNTRSMVIHYDEYGFVPQPLGTVMESSAIANTL